MSILKLLSLITSLGLAIALLLVPLEVIPTVFLLYVTCVLLINLDYRTRTELTPQGYILLGLGLLEVRLLLITPLTGIYYWIPFGIAVVMLLLVVLWGYKTK
jgi:hypothetical protein